MKEVIVMCALMLATGLGHAGSEYREAALKQAICNKAGEGMALHNQLKSSGTSLSEALEYQAESLPFHQEAVRAVYRLEMSDHDAYMIGWATCMDKIEAELGQ